MAEATELLTSRGLLVEDRDPVFSETVPANSIAEQDPPANSVVDQGTTVVIKLSRGSASIDLVELALVGQEVAMAERRLTSRGLTVEIVEVGDEEIPAGLVVEIDPATEAAIGETVLLYVSVGDAIQVPVEVQGRPVDDVERQLERAGFEIVGVEPVDRETIEDAGVEPQEAGIDPGDMVGFSAGDDAVEFDDWLPRGTEITLYYYDPSLNSSS
jgi:serine/threonine-protein kinase